MGGRGGGRILPAATLHVINFLNIKANATKLGDFFENLFGNKKIWHVSVHVTWLFHGNHILAGILISLIKKIRKAFL